MTTWCARPSARLCALLLGACATNDVAVDYTVSGLPSSGKVPWSCLPEGHAGGGDAATIAWTVGALLVVT